MLILELIIFALISLAFIVLVIIKSKRWSVALQNLYVRSTKKQDVQPVDFSESWVRVLMQGALILFSIVIVLLVFTLCFGTIYITQNSAGQSVWHLQH